MKALRLISNGVHSGMGTVKIWHIENQVCWNNQKLRSYGPRQANLVLNPYTSSEGSGEPAHPRSLAIPSLLAHISSESRRTFRQKARSLAPLNGWACAVKICHDRMLEDTNSLDAAHIMVALLTYHKGEKLSQKKCFLMQKYHRL